MKWIESYKDLSLIEDFFHAKRVAIDLETSGLEYNCIIAGFCIVSDNNSAYFPICHRESPLVEKSLAYKFLQEVVDLVPELMFHNASFDVKLLEREGIKIDDCKIRDTMIAAQLCNKQETKLKLLGLELGLDSPQFEELFKEHNSIEYPSDLVGAYCQNDGFLTLKVYDHLFSIMEKLDVTEAFLTIESPTSAVVAHMESSGILIDEQLLLTIREKAEKEKLKLETEIFNLLGGNFNLNSKEQLYNKMSVENEYWKKSDYGDKFFVGKNKKNIPSLSEDVILEIQKNCEDEIGKKVVNTIIERNKLETLLTKYLAEKSNREDSKTILEYIRDSYDKRIRPSYRQNGAITTRYSCSHPNIQQIPKFSDKGSISDIISNEIRKCFIPKLGYKFITFDFSQVELRVLAHFCQDPNMVSIYNKGIDKDGNIMKDIHEKTRVQIEKLSRKKCTRTRAKNTNFGLAFGMGAEKFSRENGVDLKDAEDSYDGFHSAYEEVKPFIKSCLNFAEKNHYMRNIIGVYRWFYKNEINLYSKAINTRIQSSAAAILKIGMLDLYRCCKIMGVLGSEISIVMTVHDEITCEVVAEKVDFYKELIKICLENAIKLRVPLIAEGGIGNNWAEAKG